MIMPVNWVCIMYFVIDGAHLITSGMGLIIQDPGWIQNACDMDTDMMVIELRPGVQMFTERRPGHAATVVLFLHRDYWGIRGVYQPYRWPIDTRSSLHLT